VDGERWGLSSNMRRASEMPHIKNIIQIGQRGIGSARPDDYRDALEWGVKFHCAFDVYKHGIDPILDQIPDNQSLIIAMDLDVMDPSITPGLIGRAPGGLTYWQIIELLHELAKRSRIAAFNLVEYMPARDVDQLGALTAARIIANVLSIINRQ
jgi:agmatinase